MKQAAKKQLLNAQKVDGAIISEENCIITHASQHTINGKLTPANPSPFIEEIDSK